MVLLRENPDIFTCENSEEGGGVLKLTEEQCLQQEEFRSFVDDEVIPYADGFDKEERIPPEVIAKIAKKGFLAGTVPVGDGGKGYDMLTHGLLCEEIGRGSASLLSLFTVHGMLAHALMQWGSSGQRAYWLRRLATGQSIGAFGLTEPETGSDAKNVKTSAVLRGSFYDLTGTKKWISCGQIADVFLIIAQCEEKPTAFLVERGTPGLTIKPIRGMMGFRSAMLAELQLEECAVPKENLVGRVGFGFSHVAATSLDYGRYCVASGSVGLARACLEACLLYSGERRQFGSLLKGHQLIQRMLSNMITKISAARLLYYQAGLQKDALDPDSITSTAIAKYFASTMVAEVAGDAVQIHGANGCSDEYPVQRYFRDAKIMEIIEGSNQMQQIMIAKYTGMCARKGRKKNSSSSG